MAEVDFINPTRQDCYEFLSMKKPTFVKIDEEAISNYANNFVNGEKGIKNNPFKLYLPPWKVDPKKPKTAQNNN